MKKQLFILGALLFGIFLSSCNSDDDLNEQQGDGFPKILSFEFLASNNDELQQDILATIDEDSKTITTLFPPNTSITSLEPTIKLSANSERVFPSEDFPMDFTNPVTYKIFGDGFNDSEYTVIVTVEDSREASITDFGFLLKANPNTNLRRDVFGEIKENTILIDFENNVNISALSPSFSISAGASVVPEIGVKQDFTNPVKYTVTAQDGVTKTEYTVKVNKNAITKVTFTINGIEQQAVINGEDVTLQVPKGTDLTGLVPTIEISSGNTINPASGVAQNYNDLVFYTVTRADGSTKKYRFDVFEEDSARSDRAALVEFYKLNNKPGNASPITGGVGEYLRNWDLDASEIQNNWQGITVNNEGRVTVINIGISSLIKVYEIPPSFGGLSKLQQMFFIDVRLESLPSEIGNLSDLWFLSFIDNQLTSLPTGLDNLSSLQVLVLEGNRFEEVPVERIKNIRNLRSLLLRDNNLTSIPKELGELTNLGSLDLRENPVTSIPKEVCNLFQNNDNLKLDDDDVCEG